MPEVHIDYAHELQTVFGLLTDPDAVRVRCEALGERNVAVRIDDPAGPSLTIERDITAALPGFASRLFDATQRVCEQAIWAQTPAGALGRSRMALGRAGTVQMTTTLTARSGGCRCTVDYWVDGRVPRPVRARLEAFLAGATRDAILAEHEHYRATLDGHCV